MRITAAAKLATEAAAIDFVRDAFGHLKFVGYTAAATALLEAAGVADKMDEGFIAVDKAADMAAFIAKAKTHRLWEREPKLRSPG